MAAAAASGWTARHPSAQTAAYFLLELVDTEADIKKFAREITRAQDEQVCDGEWKEAENSIIAGLDQGLYRAFAAANLMVDMKAENIVDAAVAATTAKSYTPARTVMDAMS